MYFKILYVTAWARILSSKNMQKWESETIEVLGIKAEILMIKACQAFIRTLQDLKILRPDMKVAILAGPGSNGGDGIHLFKMLNKMLFFCNLYYFGNQHSTNYNNIYVKALPEYPDFIREFPDFNHNHPFPSTLNLDKYDLIIDALFGIGLSRPLNDHFKTLVESLTDFSNIISVDMPSGMDDQTICTNTCVQANQTISFQRPKFSQLLCENAKFVGALSIVDIGLVDDFESSLEKSNLYWIRMKEASSLLKLRLSHSHKGTFGHVLMVAGNKQSPGAAILSALGAFKAGCGKLTFVTHLNWSYTLVTSVPEAQLYIIDTDNVDEISEIPIDSTTSYSYAIGPGIGQSEYTSHALRIFLESYDQPVVLDADALNLLSEMSESFDLIPALSILTPHVKEFDCLFGAHKTSLERFETQKLHSKKYNLIIVLKGRYTSISDPNGHLYFNSSGNPGMSCGGSGDILTGIIVSLLAQGYSSLESAILGVFTHGLAGDLAKEELGEHGMMSSDIIRFLPYAFKKLVQNN